MDKSKFTLEERVKILEQEVAVLQEKIKELTECETVNIDEDVVGQNNAEPQTVDVPVSKTFTPTFVVEEPVEEPASEPVMKTVEVETEAENESSETIETPVENADFSRTSNRRFEDVISGNEGSMESKLGKKIMSILASILIFFSLVLFGKLIQPRLTPEIRTVLMYVVCFALSGVGLWRMSKPESRYKILFTAVAGCGVGGLYLSGLVARFLLETFTDWSLLISDAIWIVAVLALVKYKQGIFTYICYIGIFIATCLACINWYTNIIGLVVYVASVSALFAISYSRSYKDDWWFMLQHPVVCILMSFAYQDNLLYLCILYALIFLPLIAQLRYYEFNKDNFALALMSVCASFGGMFAITLLMDEKACPEGTYEALFVWPNALLALTAAGMAYFMSKHRETEKKVFFYLPFCIALAVVYQLDISTIYSGYVGNAFIFAILLILGVLWKDILLRYAGYFFMLAYVVQQPSELGFWSVATVFMCGWVGMVAWLRNNYVITEKFFLTGLFLALFADMCTEIPMDSSIFYIIVGAICFAINQPFFYTDRITGKLEESSRLVGYCATETAVALGLWFIHASHSPMKFHNEFTGTETFALIAIVLITLALACLNVKSLYAKYGEEFEKPLSIFVCLKFTMLILCILLRAHALSFVISLAGIVFAIVFIVIGFYKRLKGFRLYGLVLCLVCIAKLLLVDVEYDSSVMRPVGYLAAGLLCYLISWIYTRLENRIK